MEQKELDKIKAYLSPELIIKYQAMLTKKRGQSDVIKLTNTGMVSSGKSSLFNVLTDAKGERFKTGAARTTKSADTCVMNYVEYTDTPGIDVKDEDDEIAYNTVIGSDIIMMIHNIKTGPLHRSEVEWLERIVGSIKDPEIIKKRLIFVSSWTDTRASSSDYGDIIDTVKDMVFSICGTEIPFFEVSVTKYLAGQTRKSEKMMVNSQILALKDYLLSATREYQKLKQTYILAEETQVLGEIRAILSGNRREYSESASKNAGNITRQYDDKRMAWARVYRVFENYCRDYTAKRRDISGGGSGGTTSINYNSPSTTTYISEMMRKMHNFWEEDD